MSSYVDSLFGLQGRVALVTGASRGIGQVVAVALARAGADIGIINRSDPAETVAAIEGLGRRVVWESADVVDEPATEQAVASVVEQLGGIDVLFNNSGICEHASIFDTTVARFREVIDVNLTGQFIVARAVARHMIDTGRHGSIINMASMSASIVNTPQDQASYNASKAGVVHLTRSLAMELVDAGIRVNSLSPGYIATPMATETPQQMRDAWVSLVPMARMADPAELVTAVLYLASSASAYTTGSDVVVDGGYTSR